MVNIQMPYQPFKIMHVFKINLLKDEKGPERHTWCVSVEMLFLNAVNCLY